MYNNMMDAEAPGVEAPLDALGADPDPPLNGCAVLARRVLPEGLGLRGDAVGETFVGLERGGDRGLALLVVLAAVRVVLADVRAHLMRAPGRCEWPAANVVSAARPAWL